MDARSILTKYWEPIILGHKRRYSKKWLVREFLKLHDLEAGVTLARLLAGYREDPAFFSIAQLGIIPWVHLTEPGRDQLGILEAVRDYDRVAVRSGHKVAKSCSLAVLALWFFATQPRARVPVTSSSFNQVRLIIWYEIKSQHRAAELRGTPVGGVLHEDPHRGLDLPDGRQIFGFSTSEPERAAGISSPRILYLLDEASGIVGVIFEAIEGNRAGGAKLAMFSNPTKVTGEYYDAFFTKQDFYYTIHIPSYFSPNCQAGRIVVPGLATLEWVAEKRREWGEHSSLYAVRVKGDFPKQDAFSIIPVDVVEDARLRHADLMGVYGADDLRIGVDVSGSGDDDAVITAVRGKVMVRQEIMEGTVRGHMIAERILKVAEEENTTGGSVTVNIDAIGEGWATVEALRGRFTRLTRRFRVNVRPIVVSEKATRSEKYRDKRTEIVYELKAWLEKGGCIMADDLLDGELVSAQYVEQKGVYLLVPKKKERELLGRSPNRRDALGLAIYRGRPYTIGHHAAGAREIDEEGGTFDNFLG